MFARHHADRTQICNVHLYAHSFRRVANQQPHFLEIENLQLVIGFPENPRDSFHAHTIIHSVIDA